MGNKAPDKSKDAGFGRSTVDKKGKSISEEVSLSERTKHCFFHDRSASINQPAPTCSLVPFRERCQIRGSLVAGWAFSSDCSQISFDECKSMVLSPA